MLDFVTPGNSEPSVAYHYPGHHYFSIIAMKNVYGIVTIKMGESTKVIVTPPQIFVWGQ